MFNVKNKKSFQNLNNQHWPLLQGTTSGFLSSISYKSSTSDLKGNTTFSLRGKAAGRSGLLNWDRRQATPAISAMANTRVHPPTKYPRTGAMSNVTGVPVCFSATFNVNPSSKIASLLPLLLTAVTMSLRTCPGLSLPTLNTGNLLDMLAWSCPLWLSRTSNRNHCGWPPSKPSMHSTSRETVVWFKMVQLNGESGCPKHQWKLKLGKCRREY